MPLTKKSEVQTTARPGPTPAKKASLFDAQQAADYLGLTVNEIEAEMAAGNLPAKLPFTKRNLDRYKERNPDRYKQPQSQ